jgi:hypothetical protein
MGLLDGIGLTDPFLNKSDKKPDDLDNLEPPKQARHEYVEWVVTEYSDHKVQK